MIKMNVSIKLKSTELRKSEPYAILLFGGDFCPVRRYETKILNHEPIFSSTLDYELRNKDFFMVNLESPLCNHIHNAKLYGGGMGCNCQLASYLKQFHIDAVGLANNHIMDKTSVGLQQTIDLLKNNGIKYCGAGDNLTEAAKMMTVQINGLNIGIWALAEKELNIATENTPGSACFSPELNVIDISRLKKQVDFLVCFVHAGHEFMLTPSPRIRNAYRSFINAGADVVIAHHPHVPQGIEKYSEGWIFYSLGNLVFDSPYVSSYEDTNIGHMVRIKVGRHRIFDIEIIPYKLSENVEVKELTRLELLNYKRFLEIVSLNITDEENFIKEWEKNVILRWNQDYKKLLSNFSSRFKDDSDKYFTAWLHNFIQCPTVEEIMCEAIKLLEKDFIDRNAKKGYGYE